MDIEEDTKSMSLNPNLEFLDILKEALTILLTNTKLLLFSAISSFPLLFFLFYFEFVLQKTVSDSSKLISQLFTGDSQSESLYNFDTMETFGYKWLYLCFLYLVPYFILDLVNMFAVLDKVSMVCVGETQRLVSDIRVKGPIITSLYVLFFSTCFVMGIIWVISDSFVLSSLFENLTYYDYGGYYDNRAIKNIFARFLIFVFHSAIFLMLMVKYSKWCAGWNMALVVSVLDEEEVSGSDAFRVSGYYSRGSEGCGMLLMLSLFLWGLILRLPCLVWGCSDNSIGVVYTFVYVVLICSGNVFKWVVSAVYIFYCKKRIMEKVADDQDTGRRPAAPKIKRLRNPLEVLSLLM